MNKFLALNISVTLIFSYKQTDPPVLRLYLDCVPNVLLTPVPVLSPLSIPRAMMSLIMVRY